MRFYRGLTVPADNAVTTVAEIKERGLITNNWSWRTEHHRPVSGLLDKHELSLDDTRPKDVTWTPAVCACGDLDGASYYAWSHNQTNTNNTPIIIEFEAELEQVAIDGKDCLYTVFQMGDPPKARKFLRAAFGEKVLTYAERAWQTENQGRRIALCDLSIHDPEVVMAHHSNILVIGGRYCTVFRSAFTVALPILAKNIRNVWVPEERSYKPYADVKLADLLK